MRLFKKRLPTRDIIEITIQLNALAVTSSVLNLSQLHKALQEQWLDTGTIRFNYQEVPVDWNTIMFLDHVITQLKNGVVDGS